METTDTAAGINFAVGQCLPFGVEVAVEGGGSDLRHLPVALLKRWVAGHRVLVLRGFERLHGSELSRFCERLGTLQVFEFGTVDEHGAIVETTTLCESSSSASFTIGQR